MAEPTEQKKKKKKKNAEIMHQIAHEEARKEVQASFPESDQR